MASFSIQLRLIDLLFRHLRVLDLIESDVTDDEVDWISCFPEKETCLESLMFDCIECPINFEALERLVSRSPSLKKLGVNRYVSIAQLYRLMIRAPHLTHLGTGSFSTSEAVVHGESEPDYASAFAACKSLVCLSGFKDILPDYLPCIYPVCANLTTLNLSFANITAEQLKPVISHCHKLQTFWVCDLWVEKSNFGGQIWYAELTFFLLLQALDSICDEGLQAVASTCKELRELRVFPVDVREDGEGPISEVGFQAISEGCRKLQYILYFCQRMTNAAVVAMSQNCQDLVVFRLCIMGRHQPDHQTGEPMDQGFGAIVINCKKLTRLAISGLLTDRAFSYIGKYGKLVRTLSVAFAGNSDLGLKYVLEGCLRLQKLEIRDSPFGDGALRSGLHHYYNMRFLWMSACKLSRQGCQEVARAMPHLVVEVMRNENDDETESSVEVEGMENHVQVLYMYRSLEGPRDDAPKFVDIL